ncbi:MAG TPA: DUF3999 family protein [Phnomibacter sp.]|nr:DUF3999 family protein [Phnomibacter sp.]
MLAANMPATGQGFTYMRTLKPDGPSGWYKWQLPPDMVAKCKPGWADLRLLAIQANGDTSEVPYAILRAEPHRAPAVPMKILDRSQRAGSFFYTMENPTAKNISEIDLDLQQQNFDLLVHLEGSHDQSTWFTLLKEYRIVAISNAATKYHFTKLIFNESTYRYFRMNVASDKDPVLMAASCNAIPLSQQSWYTYPSFKQRGQAVTEKKQTYWYIQLPQKMPVSRLQVHIADPVEFIRPLQMQKPLDMPYAPNREKEYITITTDMLSSFEKNIFYIPETLTDELRLVVDHNDNVPIRIDSVTLYTEPEEIWARLPDAGEYMLVYGDRSLIAPQYDILAIIENKRPLPYTKMTLGDEVPFNALRAEGRWWEKGVYLYSLMGAVILLLGWFSLKMMRKVG